MKKLILILAASMLFAFQAKPQSILMVGDTVVNTATVNMDLKTVNNYDNVSFQLIATKLTGTVAGTAILQASNDGTNWLTINTAGADTFTVTNVATQSYFWNELPNHYLWYRINVVGSGTSTYIVKTYAMPRNF